MSTRAVPALFLDTRRPDLANEGNDSENRETAHQLQIVGHPQWLDDRLAATASAEGDRAALAIAYREHGAECTGVLAGEFAFLVHDMARERVVAATDRLGREPLYFRVIDECLLLASSIASLAEAGPAPLSAQGIYNYIYFHMIPAPGSIYQGIGKLRAGETLCWEEGKLTISRYWAPDFGQRQGVSQASLAAELRTTLRAAVEKRATTPTVGAFLSGGLDSSTVAGMLAECSGSTAQAFAIGFDAEGYDEMAYARITAGHFGLKLHEYYVTPEDIVSALPDIATHYGEPFGNSSALPAYFCARLAASQGVHHLLAGDGGDELFAGNERYARQQVFARYARLPAAVRRMLAGPMLSALPSALPLADKARSYVQQAQTPLPDRLQSYNFLHRHAPAELFRPEFLAAVDTSEPLTLLRDVYHKPAHASELDRMLYLDWQFTLADNDLRKVSQMCRYAGIDVSYPMLDDELVNLSLRVPDRMKLRGTVLRHFYKEALRGWLPDATINKSKHGFGLPFGVWMQSHAPLKQLALDSLLDLKERPYFNPTFIDRTIELHRSGHASYYGELVWILMVLELWLRNHR